MHLPETLYARIGELFYSGYMVFVSSFPVCALVFHVTEENTVLQKLVISLH